jgi:hypothetical protein
VTHFPSRLHAVKYSPDGSLDPVLCTTTTRLTTPLGTIDEDLAHSLSSKGTKLTDKEQ